MSELDGLNERARLLLKDIVQRYIDDGLPVGSKTIAEGSQLGLSAATIRSIMSELEDKGYLFSPHTSAGRVPTTQGFRLFVDHLVTVAPIEEAQIAVLKQEMGDEGSTSELINSVSNILVQFSKMASIVQVPSPALSTLRHVDFLCLGSNKILVILVTGDGDVHNRVIFTDRVYSAAELERMGNYLNAESVGLSLEQVRVKLQKDLNRVRGEVNEIMSAIIDVGQHYARETKGRAGLVVKGESNLLSPGMSDADRLKALFNAFHEKSGILAVIDECIRADGVEIFIGAESDHEFIADCSLITSPYEQDGQVIGVLGVIGPTRMDYRRVIPIVEISAKILSSALNRAQLAP